jgi:hypothetical protein
MHKGKYLWQVPKFKLHLDTTKKTKPHQTIHILCSEMTPQREENRSQIHINEL